MNLKDYNKNGFLIARQAMPVEHINSLQSEIRKVFELQLGKTVSDKDIFDLYERDMTTYLACTKACNNLFSLYALCAHPVINDLLRQIGYKIPSISAKPYLHFSSRHLAATHNFYWKTNPHQDWAAQRGSLDSVVVWFPVCPFGKDMGYLEVAPGSHKNGLRNHVETGPTFELDHCEEEFISVPMQMGDVLIFSSLLVHRSGNNTSEKIRFAANFRYDNAAEPTFVERQFPQPFCYVRTVPEIEKGFPSVKLLEKVFTSDEQLVEMFG